MVFRSVSLHLSPSPLLSRPAYESLCMPRRSQQTTAGIVPSHHVLCHQCFTVAMNVEYFAVLISKLIFTSTVEMPVDTFGPQNHKKCSFYAPKHGLQPIKEGCRFPWHWIDSLYFGITSLKSPCELMRIWHPNVLSGWKRKVAPKVTRLKISSYSLSQVYLNSLNHPVTTQKYNLDMHWLLLPFPLIKLQNYFGIPES